MTKQKTNDEFVKELHDINSFIIPLTPYQGANHIMRFHCNICGNEWEAIAFHELHRIGQGCSKCSYLAAGKRRRKDNNDFVDELKRKNANVTPLMQYNGNKQKIKCKCNLCGNIWESTPDKLLRGIGCPSCYHSATSFIEQFIYLSLSFVLGRNSVFSRDKKAIGKELDIYVPSLGLAIEYGSWYWHKKRIKKDAEKRKMCQDNNIRLISIYDGCKDELIESNADILVFTNDLSLENSYKTVKSIIAKICDEFNLKYSELDGKWNDIISQAYQNSRKLTTAEFIQLVKVKNTHNIEILGEYKSSYDAIHCRCNDCGYEWSPRPNNLLNENAGCPQCAGTRRYTDAEFVAMVSSVNPDFELLEQYRNTGNSVLCRCKKCGYEWKASPTRLLKKRLGCPKCTGRKKYTTEEFTEKMKRINPSIKLLEPYPSNNKTKILCVCNKCGNHFSMRPNNLLSGQDCPICSIKKVSLKKTKNNEEFISNLKAINPDVTTLEPYVHSKYKILCQCKKCDNQWKATPNSLLHGYGCPKCSVTKRANKAKKRVLCVETNTIYESLKAAAAESGYSNSAISMCCNEKKESVGGLHWKYIE